MNEIKAKFERIVDTLKAKPELGRGTGTCTVRLTGGLACEVEAGPYKFKIDMPATSGGTASAPTPGMYGRASLGGCLAIGYAMRAARAGITLDSLEVEIEADYDDGALFGTADKPPGYSEVRYIVRIKSSAPEAEILRVLDDSDRHSPYLDVFSRAQKVVRRVELT